MRRASIVAWIVTLLALVPPVVMAYLGGFSRLLSDDYCHIAWGEQLGVNGGLRYLHDTWNGSFTNYAVQFFFSFRGEVAAAVFPALIIAIWMLGLVLLARVALMKLGVMEGRLPLAVTFAGLLVAAAINGFHSAQSFYWMAASVAYALPVALLVLIVVIGLQLAQSASLPISAAALVVAVACFMNAGFSPMFLVFQGAVFTILLLGVTLGLRAGFLRRRSQILICAGWLATGAALLVMITAPGFWVRLGAPLAAELNLGPPIRALRELLALTLNIAHEQIGHQAAFTGFALMLSLTLCVTLSLYRRQSPRPALRAPALAKGVLWAGLVAQLFFLPILWAHTSDHARFFSRFSTGFFLVVCVNIAQILILVILLARRKRINVLLGGSQVIWRAYVAAILLFALLLFVMTQTGSIHYTAATYLFASVFALLCILLWQLAGRVSDTHSRPWRQLPLFAAGAALASYLALIALSLFALGFLSERILAGSAFLHVASGVAWGLSLGILMRRSGLVTRTDGAASRLYQSGAALVVVVLASGIVIGQSRRLPALIAFATEWDARNGEIVRQRDSGSEAIVVPELSYNLGDLVHGFHIFDDTYNYCPKLYYGVDSITRSGGDAWISDENSESD